MADPDATPAEVESALEALRASEAKFAAAFRTSPDSININRLSDGLYLEINDGFTRLTGYSEQDVAGRTSIELDIWVDPGDRARLVAGLRDKGYVTNLEARFRRKDGSVTTALMSARVMTLDGETCILSVTRDISGIKAAQEALMASESRYRGLFESMLEGLAYCEMIYDQDGAPIDWTYLEVNGMFEPLTGLSGVVGKRVTDVIPGLRETNPELFEIYGRVARDGVPEGFDAMLPQLGVNLRVSAYQAGPGRFVAVFEDDTERLRAQAELRALNEDLERRVAERTEELECTNEELTSTNEELIASNAQLARLNEELALANAQLDDATHAKSDFLASMSHELRTPLNSIIGFSGILASGMAGELTEEQRRQVSMINNSGRYLLDLVNGVLDLAKVEAGAGESEPETIEAGAIANEMLSMVRPLAEDKKLGIALEVSSDAGTLRCDANRLRQILLNLLGNAVKFTDSGAVQLKVSREDHCVVFAVTDTGCGVAPNETDRIFEEFYQATPARGAKSAGTGLGLAVSRRIAESLGGTIRVESRLGEGSTFTLRVPVQQ